jgi:hypothetical protein
MARAQKQATEPKDKAERLVIGLTGASGVA